MQINSKADDRDVLLMAIHALTDKTRLGTFVLVIQDEDHPKSLAVWHSDGITNSVYLLDEAKKIQLRG